MICYMAVTVKIPDMADNLKKYGGFIPGIRPGKPTADYLDHVLTRITLAGSVFLAFIAVLPTVIVMATHIEVLHFRRYGRSSSSVSHCRR